MTLHIQLLSQVRASSLVCPHSPDPSYKRTNGQRQPTFAVLQIHPLCTGNAAAPSNLDCSSTTSPRVLKPSMFLAHFSVLPTDVDRWEGPSDECSPGGWIKRTMDWSRFSSLFDIHGEYRGKLLDEYSMRKGKRV